MCLYVYIYICKHNLITLQCLEDETPHKQYINLKFWKWKYQEKNKKSLHVGTTKKQVTYAHTLIFFHKELHEFEVKNPISSVKRIELSVKFKLFQWCHDLFTVLCLSLDWKIHFNLDFVLKSFRCSKRDVWCVLLKTLQNDPTRLL